MADLSSEIRNLNGVYGHNLGDLHDDFTHIRMLWRDLQARVEHGNESPSASNPITGTIVEGTALAAKAPASLERLRTRSFKDIVAQLELFTAELLRIWLFANPALMSEKALTLETLLSSTSLVEAQAAAVNEAVESTIADKMYGRPEKWFNYLRKNLGAQFSAEDGLALIRKIAADAIAKFNVA
jgi:hypothetical protein